MGFNIQTILSFLIIGWYYRREIRQEIKEIREETQAIREDIKNQGIRTDKLYELLVEERKETNKRFTEVDQKFYDLLKAQKT